MTLVALSLQPLDYIKGYAEALSEVKALNDEVASTEGALHLCLDYAHDSRQLVAFAPSADIREENAGRVQAFVECAEVYRQVGEIYGWAASPNLVDFINWRLTLSLGLINKEQ